MSALSAISLSGMKTAQFALGASAHNIANLSTADFRPYLVSLEGHDALEAHIVGQLTAELLANLAVFKTSDRVLGASLDIAG